MSRPANRSLLLLLSLVIALLPLRYAMAGPWSLEMGGDATMGQAMSGCVGMSMSAGGDGVSCPGHLQGKDSGRQCCDDHCGGSMQLLHQIDTWTPWATLSERFPEPVSVLPDIVIPPRHRPPLSLS